MVKIVFKCLAIVAVSALLTYGLAKTAMNERVTTGVITQGETKYGGEYGLLLLVPLGFIWVIEKHNKNSDWRD